MTRPTLYIGLGGTGKEVLLRLRRKIFKANWNGTGLHDLADFPLASFVHFDGYMEQHEYRRDTRDEVIGFKERELLTRRLDPRIYLNQIELFPDVERWFPLEGRRTIGGDQFPNGQARCFSRLLFFHQYQSLRHLLRQQATDLLAKAADQAALDRLGLFADRNLRVVVVASSCGGMGSGTFIDVGYLAQSLDGVGSSDVNLVLLLAGGFQGAGRRRVNANTVAALAELDHYMQFAPDPAYDGPQALRDVLGDRPRRPYSEAYIIDTENLARMQIGSIDTLYDTTADVLFDDFGDDPYREERRVIAINQQQHKCLSLPAVSGGQTSSHRMAYSSFGQSSIETSGDAVRDYVVAMTCKGILLGYAGIDAAEYDRVPTMQDRDEFLVEQFWLENTAFECPLAPRSSAVLPIVEFALVDHLLRTLDGLSLPRFACEQIAARVDALKQNEARATWLKSLHEIFERLVVDLEPGLDGVREAGCYAREVRAAGARTRLEIGCDNGRPPLLRRYLDRLERGGVDFTFSLIKAAHQRIAADIEVLRAALSQYEACQMAAEESWHAAMQGLEKGLSRRIFPLGKTGADKRLSAVQRALQRFAVATLRRQSCGEAIMVLEHAKHLLGENIAARDEDIYSGALGYVAQGRADVLIMVGDFEADERSARLRIDGMKADGTKDLSRLQVPAANWRDIEDMVPSGAELRDWVKSIRDVLGPLSLLLQELQNPAKRAAVTRDLQTTVEVMLRPGWAKLRSVQDVLLGMTEAARADILAQAMKRAVPLIPVDLEPIARAGQDVAGRIRVIVGVEDAESFRRSALMDAVAAARSFAMVDVPRAVTTGERERIVVYSELSGFALACITPLYTAWLADYRGERYTGSMPLHNSRTEDVFAATVVPVPD